MLGAGDDMPDGALRGAMNEERIHAERYPIDEVSRRSAPMPPASGMALASTG